MSLTEDVTDQVDLSKQQKQICKFCKAHEVFDSDSDNLIIRPCKCVKLNTAFCHVGCLARHARQFMARVEQPNSSVYQWEAFCCGSCRADYPVQLKLKDRAINLVNFRRPRWPCIVFEKVTPQEIGKTSMGEVVVLKFGKQQQLSIGQGPQNDLRLCDMTASVVHSKIVFQDNRFHLFDQESRFGTLVELRRPFELFSNGVAVQVHNVVFYFYVENKKQVTQIKKKKFKRFQIESNTAFVTLFKNLKTRMKSISLTETTQTHDFD